MCFYRYLSFRHYRQRSTGLRRFTVRILWVRKLGPLACRCLGGWRPTDGGIMAETKVLPFFTIDSWVELLAEALIPKHKFDGDLWIWWDLMVCRHRKYMQNIQKPSTKSWAENCPAVVVERTDFWKPWLWWLLVRAIRASGWCSCTAYEKWQRWGLSERSGLLIDWIKRIREEIPKKETW